MAQPPRVNLEPTTLDLAPLTERVSKGEVNAYGRAVRKGLGLHDQRPVKILVLVLCTGPVLLTLVLWYNGIVGLVTTSRWSALVPAAGLTFVGGATLLLFRLIGIYDEIFGTPAVTWFRLDRFAHANNLRFIPRDDAPALPGMIFRQGRNRQAMEVIRAEGPRWREIANYRYTTGSGKSHTIHRWGYAALKLETPLPHIVLDARRNNTVFGTNLPESLARSQRLRLEGDFDRHFALYCPEGYEQDALYLFSPDIMALFIDHSARLDVEIVDNMLFLYSPRKLATADPDTWAWLFATLHALDSKVTRWENWRDSRLGDGADASATGGLPLPLRPSPGVAREGRRLRTVIPWWAYVLFAAFATFFIARWSGLLP